LPNRWWAITGPNTFSSCAHPWPATAPTRYSLLECDKEIQALLAHFQTQADPAWMPTPTQKPHKPQRNQFHFDLQAEHYRILGVDLTRVPGLETLSVHTLLSELGPDLSAFPHEGEFASWLGLCPHRRITGGRLLASRTRKVRHRLPRALRMAAQSLHHSQSWLGEFYRRMRTQHGAPKPITITAHFDVLLKARFAASSWWR